MKRKELFLIIVLIVSIIIGGILVIMEMNRQSELMKSSKINVIRRIK